MSDICKTAPGFKWNQFRKGFFINSRYGPCYVVIWLLNWTEQNIFYNNRILILPWTFVWSTLYPGLDKCYTNKVIIIIIINKKAFCRTFYPKQCNSNNLSHTHTPSQTVTFQDGETAAGEEFCSGRVAVRQGSRGHGVYWCVTDDLWCDGSWGHLTDTTITKENTNGMCQALSTPVS